MQLEAIFMKKLQGTLIVTQKVGMMGIRHLSSAVEKETGVAPKLCFLAKDPAYSQYSEGELGGIKKIVENDGWIGISASALALGRVRQIIGMLKAELPGIPIFVGGVQAVMTPEMFLDMGADAVCRQEGEIWLPEALRMLASGQTIPRNFETAAPIHNLVPPPDYDYSQGTHYVLKSGFVRLITTSEAEFSAAGNFSFSDLEADGTKGRMGARFPLWQFTQRRCKSRCTYCCNYKFAQFDKVHGGPPERLTTENVILQVSETIAKNSIIDFVIFFDDDFFERFRAGNSVDKGELEAFCKGWKSQVRRPFFTYFRPTTFDVEIFESLVDAGLRQVTFGFQTASPETLRIYGRRQPGSSDILGITSILSKAVKEGKIDTPDIDLLINSPFESATDIRRTIEALLSFTPPFDTQMHNMHLFPGYGITEMFEAGRATPLPGFRIVLDREYQDHCGHSDWIWANLEDDKAYFTLLQMLMTGVCDERMLGVLERKDMQAWLALAPAERKTRESELRALFDSNPRIKYYEGMDGESK